MATQSLIQNYFFDIEQLKHLVSVDTKFKKRERPLKWRKFYSVYAYDFTGYHNFCKQNPIPLNIIPQEFYILENGTKKHLGDEKHIFRIKALHSIYTKIYDFCNINPFDKFDNIKRDGLTIWKEEQQAEITGSELLPINERLKLHIRLLRQLRCNKNV